MLRYYMLAPEKETNNGAAYMKTCCQTVLGK